VRVGLVCPYSLTIPGGVQGQVLALARTLRVRGHEVRVIAPCDGPPPESGVTTIGKSVPLSANGSVAPIAPDPPAVLRTLRAIAAEEFDIVHLHEPFVPGPCLSVLLTCSTPLVGTFHAAGGFPIYRLAGPLLRRPSRRLAVRCAVSEDAATLARRITGGEYEILFNGIEIERFATAPPHASSSPTILFVGRHEPRKGLRVLLDARHHLPDDVRFWIGGEGPETDELQELCGGDDRVEWLGRLSDDELCSRLRGADVFCAPSLGGESFGIVLLEAMAAGTAIVAGDNPGYRRVARPDQDALLVPPGDSEALGLALCRLLDDGDLAERLVTSGWERAKEFSMERLAGCYEQIYQRALTV
jgi:phosphatidylinositol alpha-mannosyltransferase